MTDAERELLLIVANEVWWNGTAKRDRLEVLMQAVREGIDEGGRVRRVCRFCGKEWGDHYDDECGPGTGTTWSPVLVGTVNAGATNATRGIRMPEPDEPSNSGPPMARRRR